MKHLPFIALFGVLVVSSLGLWGEEPPRDLAKELQPFCAAVAVSQMACTATIELTVDGQSQRIEASLTRYSPQAFDLNVIHTDYAVQIRRRDNATAFALPKHRIVYLGVGEVDPKDHLAPQDIIRRVFNGSSDVSTYLAVAAQADANTLKFLIGGLLKAKYNGELQQWQIDKDISFQISKEKMSIDLSALNAKANVKVLDKIPTPTAADQWPELKVVELERRELERTLARGVRRACEILAPSSQLTRPAQIGKKVEHGELRWVEGQRVVLLQGTPEQVGQAHGQLLRTEAQRCIDSVIYSFGTVQTIRTGRWFRHDLEAAYKRLAPHIPADHQRETAALAKALEIEPELAQTINVFPELFHCSGFALYGKATKDGKLVHGRVLDYMTTIGLQDSATTFIVAVDGKIPFANVGYGGFIGSVSGMNVKAISLGEMGGRGEGKWDGTPMATLMRRALEECSTLDEVTSLWKKSPRTCEYYYVFADGKTNRAVGVAATPEAVEFVAAGESHKLLGEGIPDAVVLSAGDRLAKLRERVQASYGEIDVTIAQGLMCRPVAMESNLHNVLFVPADGMLYVANASHTKPAAEMPYVKLDLKQLLGEMQSSK